MNAGNNTDGPDDEDRYMALLALTSQELSGGKRDDDSRFDNLNMERLSADEARELHDYLDANPAAFERFLERQRAATAVQRANPSLLALFLAWWGDLRPAGRYGLATAFAAVCALAIALPLLVGGTGLLEHVERGYATRDIRESQAASQDLVLRWERPDPTLGFSPTAPSEQALPFATGLALGRGKLRGEVAETVHCRSPVIFCALGEWNVFLWAATAQTQPPTETFWREQRELASRLRKAVAANDVAAKHLDRVDALLAELVSDPGRARTVRDLSEELRLFRDQFAPAQLPAL